MENIYYKKKYLKYKKKYIFLKNNLKGGTQPSLIHLKVIEDEIKKLKKSYNNNDEFDLIESHCNPIYGFLFLDAINNYWHFAFNDPITKVMKKLYFKIGNTFFEYIYEPIKNKE